MEPASRKRAADPTPLDPTFKPTRNGKKLTSRVGIVNQMAGRVAVSNLNDTAIRKRQREATVIDRDPPPNFDDIPESLSQLVDTSQKIKKAYSAAQPQALANDIRQCWELATHLSDFRLVLLACRICDHILPKVNGENQNTFELLIEDETIQLPDYYKELLGNISPYFKALFGSEFREKQSGLFKIEFTSSEHFKILLRLFKDEKLSLENLPLQDLLGLLISADRLGLNSITTPILQALVKVIDNLDTTKKHRKVLYDIFQALKATSFYGHPQIQDAIDDYCRKGDTQKLYFRKIRDNSVLSLDLSSGFTNLDDRQLVRLIKNFPHLTSLYIHSHLITDRVFDCLTQLKDLTHLSFNWCTTLTEAGLKRLKELKGLTTLSLIGYQGPIEWILNNLEIKGLVRLNLSSCMQLTDQLLACLPKCKGLTHLDLSWNEQLTDEGIKSLKEVKGLTSLNLVGCKQITDEALKSLREIKGLSTLRLKGSKNLTEKGLMSLKEVKGLTHLELQGFDVLTDEVLKGFKELKFLASLSIGESPKVTDEGLKSLQECRGLTHLDLSDCKLTDEGIKLLKELTSLTSLDLSSCDGLTDEGLKSLRLLKGLQSLTLSWCEKLTDEGMKTLKAFTRLTSLQLARCNLLTNEGIKSLKELKSLRSLDLSFCNQLTSEMLKTLHELACLRFLKLNNLQHFSFEKVYDLKQTNPQLIIRFE